MKNIAIFGSGSGSNAEKILEYFSSCTHAKVALIASNNRSSFILQRAKKHGIDSFVFSKNLRVNDYIKLAGGLADSADRNGIFVILPNGQAIKNLDRWRIGRSKIQPGSTIIVPRDSTPFNAISIFRIFTPILAKSSNKFNASLVLIPALS